MQSISKRLWKIGFHKSLFLENAIWKKRAFLKFFKNTQKGFEASFHIAFWNRSKVFKTFETGQDFFYNKEIKGTKLFQILPFLKVIFFKQGLLWARLWVLKSLCLNKTGYLNIDFEIQSMLCFRGNSFETVIFVARFWKVKPRITVVCGYPLEQSRSRTSIPAYAR